MGVRGESPTELLPVPAYELQRSILLTMYNLQIRSQVDGDTFFRIRNMAARFPNQQNLLCEMVARCDLELTELRQILMPIGHLRARVLAYYLALEEHE